MTNPTSAIRHRIAAIRQNSSERREARIHDLALREQLASYRTPREVDDLLGVIAGQEGPEAQQIRDILFDNLRPSSALTHIA